MSLIERYYSVTVYISYVYVSHTVLKVVYRVYNSIQMIYGKKPDEYLINNTIENLLNKLTYT